MLAHDPIGEDEDPMPLVALLDLARGRVGLDLELKEAGLERDVLALLEPAHREGLIVTSFLPEVIAEFRRLDETLDLGLLVEEVPGRPVTGLLSAARACGADFLAPDIALLGPEARRAAHALGRGPVGVDGQRRRDHRGAGRRPRHRDHHDRRTRPSRGRSSVTERIRTVTAGTPFWPATCVVSATDRPLVTRRRSRCGKR